MVCYNDGIMTEMLSSEPQPSVVEETIRNLSEYTEMLQRQMAEAIANPVKTGSTYEVKSPRRARRNSRPAGLISEHVLHRPPASEHIETVEEPLVDPGPVTLEDIEGMDTECRHIDPDVFYPADLKGKEKRNAINKAKAICLGCVALAKCRTYALESKEEFGVWGGLSEEDRRSIWRKQKQQR
jgi:WhiB family redox-sensing transcriptional regulator